MAEEVKQYKMRELTEHGVLMDNSKVIINDNFRKLFTGVNNLIISGKGVSSITYNEETNKLIITYGDGTIQTIELVTSDTVWEPIL